MIKETKRLVIGSFFCKKICGIGIELDLDPLFAGREHRATFELKLFYYKLWIIFK